MSAKGKGLGKGFEQKATRYTLRFAAVFVPLYAVLLATEFTGIQEWLAGFVGGIAGGTVSGNVVVMGASGAFAVTQSCLGLFSGFLLAGLVLASQKPCLGKRIAWAVAGIVALFVLNVPRLLAVLWSAQAWGSAAAQWVHVLTWFVMTLFVLCVWYWFARREAGDVSELI